MSITIEISPGEFFDRWGILQIKKSKIGDPAKKQIVNRELKQLHPHWLALMSMAAEKGIGPVVEATSNVLRDTNEALWVIEDEVRLHEVEQNFNDRFIQLARSVYKTNDRRAQLKTDLSRLYEVDVYEVKSHV